MSPAVIGGRARGAMASGSGGGGGRGRGAVGVPRGGAPRLAIYDKATGEAQPRPCPGPEWRLPPEGQAPAVYPFQSLVRSRRLQDLSGDGGVRKQELRPGTGQAVPPDASVAGTAGAARPVVLLAEVLWLGASCRSRRFLHLSRSCVWSAAWLQPPSCSGCCMQPWPGSPWVLVRSAAVLYSDGHKLAGSSARLLRSLLCKWQLLNLI